MRTDRDRLLDIVEAIELIEKYARMGREAFDQDELIQTWMVKHLENIGEAARTLSRQLQDQHPEIPWADIVAQRTFLAHEYFAIDGERVWDTVEHYIPVLKKQVMAILQDLP
ncbi:MAG: DUF86 domain-containing protein [Candidatus Melainabacteria bacterium]|nr:DUF86 domain-containing protein [Candidatus Melainabacteria bacterium]